MDIGSILPIYNIIEKEQWGNNLIFRV
jgi:hypothetical protein